MNLIKKATRWQEQFNQVIEKWYGKERRAGKTIYSHPSISHEERLANSKFKLEIEDLPPFEITWTIDAILGNHYSTSFGLKRFLKDQVEGFENEVKETLLAINKEGVFKESLNISIKLGIKNEGLSRPLQ